MKTLRLLSLCAIVALMAGSALGQGSGPDGEPVASSAGGDRNSFSAPTSLTGVVTQIDQAEYALAVTDESSGKQWVFKIEKGTRLRADKGVFEGKKINWSQLQVGQRIRVTFHTRAQAGTANLGQNVVEIKVRKPKKT